MELNPGYALITTDEYKELIETSFYQEEIIHENEKLRKEIREIQEFMLEENIDKYDLKKKELDSSEAELRNIQKLSTAVNAEKINTDETLRKYRGELEKLQNAGELFEKLNAMKSSAESEKLYLENIKSDFTEYQKLIRMIENDKNKIAQIIYDKLNDSRG